MTLSHRDRGAAVRDATSPRSPGVFVVLGLVLVAAACSATSRSEEISQGASVALETVEAFEQPDRYGFALEPIGFGLPQCLAGIEPIVGVVDGDRVAAEPTDRPGELRLIDGALFARTDLFAAPPPAAADTLPASWVRFDPQSAARERLDEVLGSMLASYVATGTVPPDPATTVLAAAEAAARIVELPAPAGIDGTRLRVEIDETAFRDANGLDDTDEMASVPSVTATITDAGQVVELEVRLPGGAEHAGDGAGYRVRFFAASTTGHESLVQAPTSTTVQVLDGDDLAALDRAAVECGLGISTSIPTRAPLRG